MRPPPFTLFLTATLALVSSLSSFPTEGAANSTVELKAIRFSVVSLEPRAKIAEYLDLTTYIGAKLAPGVKGEVVVASDLHQLANLIQEKKVDIYVESAYPTFVINKRTGAKILLRGWKGQVPEYSTVLFTKRDSGIAELKDLLGKMIAFEDRGSTSGFLAPKAFLMKRGFKLVEKSSFADPVSPQEIGYVFAHSSEANILNWVLLKKVSVGAFNDSEFNQLEEARRRELSILAKTDNLPRQLLSVRGDLDPAAVQRIKEILLTMHEDEAGRKALQKAAKTRKFDLLPGGEETVYRKIEDLFGVLKEKTP